MSKSFVSHYENPTIKKNTQKRASKENTDDTLNH